MRTARCIRGAGQASQPEAGVEQERGPFKGLKESQVGCSSDRWRAKMRLQESHYQQCSQSLYEVHRKEFEFHSNNMGAIGCVLDTFWCFESKCVILEAGKPMLLLHSFCLLVQVTPQLCMPNYLQNEPFVQLNDIRLWYLHLCLDSATDHSATLSMFLSLPGPQFLPWKIILSDWILHFHDFLLKVIDTQSKTDLSRK